MLHRKLRLGISVVLFSILLSSYEIRAAGSDQKEKRIVSYVAGWATKPEFGLNISRIPADLLTHINYAFIPVSAKGTCYKDSPALDDANFSALRTLREKHPHLRLLISLAGGPSTGFRVAAQSPENRRTFAESCVSLMEAIGFDGIDVDWEFPVTPKEKKNYAMLLAELRSRLSRNQDGGTARRYLTIAAPASKRCIVDVPWNEVQQSVDWINLMTYDYSRSNGPNSRAGLNAPLYPPQGGQSDNSELSVHGTVETYLKAGIQPEKLLLGIPFYGRGWDGVSGLENGFSKRAQTAAGGKLNGRAFYFKDIKKNQLGSFQRVWHEKAKVPWLYDRSTQVMISYDDEESITEKANYAMRRNLGGLMIWEISKDDDSNSLLATAASGMQRSI